MQSISLTVNGRSVDLNVATHTLLVDFLRRDLGLTGTHQGCDTTQCGACTVLMDGRSVKSCSVLAVQAQGCSVTTVEGLASADSGLHPVQEAFVACHGLQCGFCTPGMLMTTVCLLQTTPQPSTAQIENALEGNLCRCTGYVNIVAAVQDAAQRLAKEGA